MNYKKILLLVFAVLVFISCEDENISPYKDNPSVSLDKTLSIVPERIQFSKNKVYHFKIALTTDYMREDGFAPKAFFVMDESRIEMDIFDDGINDDSLRNDLAASNNIWSGGINAADFPKEGNWDLKVEFLLNDSLLIGTDSISPVYIVKNSLPEIGTVTGLTSPDVFDSGFDPRVIQAAVSDSNNTIAPFDSQKLNLSLYSFAGVKLKESTYSRSDTARDFVFSIDSTYAAGLKTLRNYRMRLEATDLYGESSFIDYANITLRNFAPSLNSLVYPDTVFIPSQDSIYFSVTVKTNDPQGHLEFQDIDEVLITLNSFPFTMRDDGNENSFPYNSGDLVKNDGVFTATFKVKSTNVENIYPFTIQATDKAENTSQVISGQLIFKKNDVKSSKRSTDEIMPDFINPFN